VLAPATSLDGMQQVVTNTTIDGILAAFFALLVIVVIADATRVCVKALRQPETVTTTEVPYVRSTLVAPAGLVATKEEKFAMSAAGAGGPEQGGRE
jgi:carbon starvation protein